MPREFKTILCGSDFSEHSYRALEYAVRFAKLSDGTVLLAHLIHIASGELKQGGHLIKIDEAKQRAHTLLEEARQKHAGGYPKVELLVDLGDPYERLLEIATERHVDLIVTSTHGRSALQHLVIGSVAEKLIRHAPCPVFVVRRAT